MRKTNRSQAPKVLLVFMLLSIAVLSGCVGNTDSPLESANDDNPLAPTLSPTPSPAADANKLDSGSGDMAPERINLTYLPVDSPPESTITVDKSDVLEKKTLGRGLIAYANKTNESTTELFLGLTDDSGGVTVIGSLYEEHYLSEVTVEEMELFERRMIVVQGLCGANCAVNYLLEGGDGAVSPYAVLYGGLQFAELDGDGHDEMLVYVGGTIAEIELYRLVEGRLAKVNVNEALGTADGVRYNAESNVFETAVQGRQVHYRYSHKEDSLELAE